MSYFQNEQGKASRIKLFSQLCFEYTKAGKLLNFPLALLGYLLKLWRAAVCWELHLVSYSDVCSKVLIRVHRVKQEKKMHTLLKEFFSPDITLLLFENISIEEMIVLYFSI